PLHRPRRELRALLRARRPRRGAARPGRREPRPGQGGGRALRPRLLARARAERGGAARGDAAVPAHPAPARGGAVTRLPLLALTPFPPNRQATEGGAGGVGR